MKHTLLLGYQWLTGISDTGAGILLYLAPAFTLRLMGVQAPADAMPFVGYVGAFVLAVGLTCLYGALLLTLRKAPERVETIWLITALLRGAVAIYVFQSILTGVLEPGWIGVTLFDGACVVVQAIGLKRRWLCNACD
jgi:hypothetical protein